MTGRGAPRRAVVSYRGAHARVSRDRGRAADQVCPCGAQAAHWSYDGTDPDQRVDDRGRPYSGDVTRYHPLCVPCHKRQDLARLGKTAKCGTDSGYYKHVRRPAEPACRPCLDAHRVAENRRAAARRERQLDELV